MEFATRSKIKNVQIKYQVFPKNGLRRIPPHSPRRSAYCILYLKEGVILLIFKYLRPLIFRKTHGISLEKSRNFIPGKEYKPWKSNILLKTILFSCRRYFHPISTVGGPHSSSSPVELHVTNLDQNIEPGDLKRILGACFSEHVTCGVHVSVFTQSDGTLAAAVKLR
jgi:hypothetical protein